MSQQPLMSGTERRSQSFELERPNYAPPQAPPQRTEEDGRSKRPISSSSGSDDDDGGGRGAAAAAADTSGRLPSLRYTVTEVPPWHVCLMLGFQHYLTMLGSTVVIPALLVPSMGGSQADQARVVQTIFFVSGINTLIQTSIGDRLPIVQGGSFSFLKPAFSVIAIIKATQVFPSEHDRFMYTMRELQGSIIGSSVLVMAIGYSGAMGALLRFVSPVVVAPTVCMVGLSLYSVGFSGVADCIEQGLLAIVTVILFSQVLKRVELPLPRGVLSRPASSANLLAAGAEWSSGSAGLGTAVAGALGGGGALRGRRAGGGSSGVRIFELFPLLWSILVCWGVAGLLTAFGAYDSTSPERKASCRTDNWQAMAAAPWLYLPYPLQWGLPIFRPASIVTMMAGALAAMIESTGDYYACARMCGAPTPPPFVISRGIGAEGLGCFMCGLFGTGNGTTSYAENIGAIGLTGVGSRRVVQAGAAIMLVLAVLGKFGALFASLPGAIVAGLFCCVFGLIAAVGLSNLQFTDQNSSRNLIIVGFAIYMALSVPNYFDTYAAAHGGAGPIATSSKHFNDITNTLFSTPMCVALMLAFLLDNTIEGTARERGLTHWSTLVTAPARGARARRLRRERRRAAAAAAAEGGPRAGEHDKDGLLSYGPGGSGSGSGSDSGDEEEDDPALDPRNDPRVKAVYDLPFGLQPFNERFILPYRIAVHRTARAMWRAARRRCRRTWRAVKARCGCGRGRRSAPQSQGRADADGDGLDAGGPLYHAGSGGLGTGTTSYENFANKGPLDCIDEEAAPPVDVSLVRPSSERGRG